MNIEQSHIQLCCRLLAKLMCENGNEHGSHIKASKTKLLNWWTNCGGNGDIETLEACIHHIAETPFDITNSTGTFTLPFIEKYEDKDGFFIIKFCQKYLQEFVRKAVEVSVENKDS